MMKVSWFSKCPTGCPVLGHLEMRYFLFDYLETVDKLAHETDIFSIYIYIIYIYCVLACLWDGEARKSNKEGGRRWNQIPPGRLL